MAAVSLSGIHKHFGSTPVIRGIDLHIADGEFTVLVGPSGCGKSTLLRLLAGLEDVDEGAGEVRIGARIVNHLSPTERDIAMVFQNYALYPHMTVAQNMSFALRLQRVQPAEINTRVARAAAILGLAPLLQRLPRELSGGQRQRVAMGRAIVREAQVFLFDEPLSNLDAKLRVQMRGEIKALHQRLGTTMVYVTHDQVEAMTLGDQVVVLNAGRIEQAGPPLALYDRPANRFVAGFLGSPAMNFLEGRVQAGQFVSERGVVLPLDAARAGQPGRPERPDGPAVFGIRPEHLQPSDTGVPATVQLVEPTGALTQVALDMGGHPVTAIFRERFALRSGDTLRLATEPGKSHLFDAGSGLRLN